jgi:hypothetical protein
VTQAKDLADSSTDEYNDSSKMIKILAVCNFALPMSYFCIGFIMSFGGTPLEVRRLLRYHLMYQGVHKNDVNRYPLACRRCTLSIRWMPRLLNFKSTTPFR